MQKKVDIYTTPTCHFCKEAKAFFNDPKHKIPYTEHDVANDEAARNAFFERMGGPSGVPVIVISWEEGDEKKEETIIGFDEGRLREVLDIAE